MWRCVALSSLMISAVAVPSASSQIASPSFKGKTISLIVFTSPGAAYDTYARLLARYMGKHLDGQPTIIVRNMPGAGGMAAARYLADIAPKDGTVIASLSRTLIYDPLLSKNATKIDYNKFAWLGSMAQSTAVYVSWHTSKVKTASDLHNAELLIGGTGAASETTVVSNILNGVLGLKLKLINGYEGSAAALKALEAGEVDGGFPTMEALQTTRPDWLRDKKINLLLQARRVPDSSLPDVPTANSLAKTDRDRQALDFVFPRDVIGRPFAAPPGILSDRARQLQEAFAAAVKDPELISEAQRMRIPVQLTDGPELTQVIGEVYSTPASTINFVRQFVTAD